MRVSLLDPSLARQAPNHFHGILDILAMEGTGRRCRQLAVACDAAESKNGNKVDPVAFHVSLRPGPFAKQVWRVPHDCSPG